MRNDGDWSTGHTTWPQLLRSLPHAVRGRRSDKLRNADVEEYWNQHQPTLLSEFLRPLHATFIGASSIGAYGENGFSRKKIGARPLSTTKFGPRIGWRMLEFFWKFGEDSFTLAPKNVTFRQIFEKYISQK